MAEVQRARGQQTRTLNNCLRGSRTDFHLFCFLCHAHEGCVYARLVILSIICLATEEKEKYTIAREDDLSEGERNESARFGSVHIWKGFFIASIFRRTEGTLHQDDLWRVLGFVEVRRERSGARRKRKKMKKQGLCTTLTCVQYNAEKEVAHGHARLQCSDFVFRCTIKV